VKIGRRSFLWTSAGAGAALAGYQPRAASTSSGSRSRVPVIDITDLYHPPQDPGDNVDLIAAYALPEVDLKAVLFDVTQRYRRPYVTADHLYEDPAGNRDPGFIPVAQLNALFGRNVPCGCAPFEPMRGPDDKMEDAPAFQQAGVDLMLEVLEESAAPVDIVSFGSARPLAVAYNRAPRLLKDKVRRVHLCAGGQPAGYLEWNVMLDPDAFVRVLRSDLPVDIYPCATEKGPFDLGPHNTFWLLPDLEFIRHMPPGLQRYLAYAFERSNRVDFLNALEDDVPPDVLDRICAKPHNVWETAVWMQVAGRRLVRCDDRRWQIKPASEIEAGDEVLREEMQPCRLDVRDDGQFDAMADAASNKRVYFREKPGEYQQAMREALGELYRRFELKSAT